MGTHTERREPGMRMEDQQLCDTEAEGRGAWVEAGGGGKKTTNKHSGLVTTV